jgi:hypothetical protein
MYFAHNSRLDFQPFVLGIGALEFMSLSHEIVRELGRILDKWDNDEEVPLDSEYFTVSDHEMTSMTSTST